MAVIKLPESKVQQLKNICKSFNNDKGELINVLHKAQEIFGYLPAEVQEVVAKELNVSVAHVYGIVSFYSFFSMVPKGKFSISICLGTACYVRGAEKVLDEFRKQLNIQVGESTPDGRFSLSCLRCVGACGLAPVVMIGEKVYGRVAPEDVKGIINEYANL
ncbi:MAG TPA: NAD(P)H-dependent oxidoreductase subunit E [Bacteroidales bacterium]|jgi:NADH-quinone oxidoreductase subunit E/NADP-reducing hydrogenase subunit HndA|nr:NAD(P)H-dependent oxidoreductase subunit E [Bacteroidales bacterium]MDI9574319.1 NAD(P)H-dependent oxidoreductase subunit E [Bacteroidota bacterium]OQC61638.1 MAG: NADP-reducing hydrogenase subunit HndA [Bacteroidetes bacterium ADurb.Bin012]MBP9512601.1 NAD(P)H-dependent oxidoreductase subunit E [Bacteroidales bacterium]MBP9587509.1 NAD(P)H-dependent oxidoreductase subunit E [Bacteroidales bacterium]